MINKLLITCLQRNKRLIIPELGAFIRKNIEGVGVILVFVPFLNKDDGVLLAALQSWAGVERDEAQLILQEYVAYIRESLTKRGQYIIEGIGVLKYDANKVIYLAKESEAEAEIPQTAASATTQPLSPIQQRGAETLREIAESAREIMNDSPLRRSPQESATAQQNRNDYDDNYDGYDDQGYNSKAPDYSEAASRTRRDLGARYFSPERGEAPTQTGRDTYNQQPRRTHEGGALYGSSSMGGGTRQSADIQEQQRVGSIYGERRANAAPIPERQPMQAPGQYQQQGQPGVTQHQAAQGQSNNKRPVPAYMDPTDRKRRKKKSDTVFIIAIIAIIASLGVLVYGFMFNGKQDRLDLNKEVQEIIQPSEDQQVPDSTTDVPVL